MSLAGEIKQGNLFKEKLEYFKERFQTKTGLADFFIGSAIFSFAVVNYTEEIFAIIFSYFSFVGNEILQYYFSYLAFSVMLSGIGLAISYAIAKAIQGRV